MKAIRFFTRDSGLADVEEVVIPDDTFFGGKAKIVHRGKRTGSDFHCPEKGKSVLVVVMTGHLSLFLRSGSSCTLGPRGDYKAALFEDWEPDDVALAKKKGHRSKVGRTDVDQLVVIADAGTIPTTGA